MKKIASFTIRMPVEKKNRPRLFAKKNEMSVNHLIEELATIVLPENDAYNRFLAGAGREISTQVSRFCRK